MTTENELLHVVEDSSIDAAELHEPENKHISILIRKWLAKYLPSKIQLDRLLRIPRQSGHQFHANVATDSTAIWPLIPRQSGHPFHGKAATDSTVIRPPFCGPVGRT